jgi:hypothetical protein
MNTDIAYKLPVTGSSITNSPIWWQNFTEVTDFYRRTLRIEYNALYVVPDEYDRTQDYILFPDEESAMFFKLKWS